MVDERLGHAGNRDVFQASLVENHCHLIQTDSTLLQRTHRKQNKNRISILVIHKILIIPAVTLFISKYRKEGNVLFNDVLNIFYLRLYGVGHMVKDHSDRLLFPISSKVFLYAPSHRQDSTYHSPC